VAKAVKEGQQKVQYVYRNFPTGSSFGKKAVQYFSELFQEAKVAPKRVVLMYCNDLFGQNNAKGFQAAHARPSPAGDRRRDPVARAAPGPLHRGVAGQGAKPDIIAPITRPGARSCCCPRSASSGSDIMGVVGPGSPGLYEAARSRCSRRIWSTC